MYQSNNFSNTKSNNFMIEPHEIKPVTTPNLSPEGLREP